MSRRRRFRALNARGLHQVILDVHSRSSEAGTVQAVVDAVVASAGFEIAAVSVVRTRDTMETVAVAGNDEARAQLVGLRKPRSIYDEEFAVAQHWGRLLFVPHVRVPDAARRGWVPQSSRSQRRGRRGRWHPLDALYAPLYSPGGEFVGVLSVDLPVGGGRPRRRQRQLLEILAVQAGIAIDNARLGEQLGANEKLFRWAFERAGVGMALISLSPEDFAHIVEVNTTFCDIVGHLAPALTEMTVDDLTYPADRDEGARLLASLRDGERSSYRRETRYLTGTGATVWASLTVAHVGSPDGSVQYAVAQVVDITESRARERELHARANQDALTGLYNRSAILGRLSEAIQTAERTGRQGAVLFVDLDGFKKVNDDHGHLTGDQALPVVAQRLRSSIRKGDAVGRIGGDEFLVVADDLAAGGAQEMAVRIADAIAEPIPLPAGHLAITASVGHCSILTSGSTPDALVESADLAMYRIKRSRSLEFPGRD